MASTARTAFSRCCCRSGLSLWRWGSCGELSAPRTRPGVIADSQADDAAPTAQPPQTEPEPPRLRPPVRVAGGDPGAPASAGANGHRLTTAVGSEPGDCRQHWSEAADRPSQRRGRPGRERSGAGKNRLAQPWPNTAESDACNSGTSLLICKDNDLGPGSSGSGWISSRPWRCWPPASWARPPWRCRVLHDEAPFAPVAEGEWEVLRTS